MVHTVRGPDAAPAPTAATKGNGMTGTETPLSAIITTLGERRRSLAAAVHSILDQRTEAGEHWPVEVLVVFDDERVLRPEEFGVDLSELPLGSTLRCLRNTRGKGLAGGRNTGVLAARHELVGFCDDDDLWLPGKLAAQQRVRRGHPQATAVGGSMELVTERKHLRKLVSARVGFPELLRRRVHELHPSSMTFSRSDLLGPIGLVDEDLPHGYGEDYDLALRAAGAGEIHNVTEAVVRVHWDRASYFDRKWDRIAAGLTYLLRKHPEFEHSPKGLARLAGQVAFAHAADGRTLAAFAYARAALRRDPFQVRAWAALLVASRLVSAPWLLGWPARTGHGL